MSPDEFIEQAIERGAKTSIASLDAVQRAVFLISEAEINCDANGIETFLDQYGQDWLAETATSFEAVGAIEIAQWLRAITPDTIRDDNLLDHVNEMITSRYGYDYEAVRHFVERQQSRLPK